MAVIIRFTPPHESAVVETMVEAKTSPGAASTSRSVAVAIWSTLIRLDFASKQADGLAGLGGLGFRD